MKDANFRAKKQKLGAKTAILRKGRVRRERGGRKVFLAKKKELVVNELSLFLGSVRKCGVCSEKCVKYKSHKYKPHR